MTNVKNLTTNTPKLDWDAVNTIMTCAEAVLKKCKIPSTNLDLLINLLNNKVDSTNLLNNKVVSTNLPELAKDSTNLL